MSSNRDTDEASEQSIIDRLNALTGGDPEGEHGEADDLLLEAVSPAVARAYSEACRRVGFWYA